MRVERVIPKAGLPPHAVVQRVIVHWTAGRYTPTLLDRGHYHVLINGEGKVVWGLRAVGKYAPHTRRLNTGSVGLAVCAMAGAVFGKDLGWQLLTRLQWERAAQAAAELCLAYGLPVRERTVLFHSEVERVYGIPQRGKWDIDVLPHAAHLAPAEVHAEFRRKVEWYLARERGE